MRGFLNDNQRLALACVPLSRTPYGWSRPGGDPLDSHNPRTIRALAARGLVILDETQGCCSLRPPNPEPGETP